MEKRTEEGKKRHDLGKKIWYEKKKAEKKEQELKNGEELDYPGVQISNYWKKKILAGETQVLIVKNEMIPFRKKKETGYWYNNSWKSTTVYLHREKLRLELDLTEEQMIGLDVHHKDCNKDNNDIDNLQLLSREKHNQLHGVLNRNENSKRHVCKRCGRTYYASVSNSLFYCDRCNE